MEILDKKRTGRLDGDADVFPFESAHTARLSDRLYCSGFIPPRESAPDPLTAILFVSYNVCLAVLMR